MVLDVVEQAATLATVGGAWQGGDGCLAGKRAPFV